MTNFEMVERLREKANVSYEEAKAALEASEWNLLDAMVLLEQQGKLNAEGPAQYTTREEEPEQFRHDRPNFRAFMGKVGDKIVAGVNYLLRNGFEVSRKGKVIITLPALVLLMFLLPWLWPTLILLVVGLFFGFRYAFRGPDLEKTPINSAMDKAADVAENIRQEAKNGTHNGDED